MAHLKTRRHPASTPWGYEFPDGDKVVEVADEHAVQLLRISGGEFYEVLPGDPEHPDYEPPLPAAPSVEQVADPPTAEATAPATPDPQAAPDVVGLSETADPTLAADPTADGPRRTPIAEPDPDQYEAELPADGGGTHRTRQRRQRTAE